MLNGAKDGEIEIDFAQLQLSDSEGITQYEMMNRLYYEVHLFGHKIISCTTSGFFEIINKNHLVVASKDRTGLFVNSPEFKISPSTGKKIKDWCGQTHWRRMEEIQKEIEKCTGIEGLRFIYSKYPELQDEIKPLIMERKKILETVFSQVLPNNEIIEQSKISNNGISNS